MGEVKELNQPQKLSYEQLENVAQQISMQLQQAKHQINQMSSVLSKLPYLFKVVELGDTKFSSDFVIKCISEIEDILYPKDELKSEEK